MKLYVDNLTKSMRETLISALTSGKLTIQFTDDDRQAAATGGWSRQAENYFGMLKQQHEILILGQTRESAAAAGLQPTIDTAYRGMWQGKHQTVPSLRAGFESAIGPNATQPNRDGAYRFNLGSVHARYGEPVTLARSACEILLRPLGLGMR